MVCCPGTESLDGCEVSNLCIPQSAFGNGKDGTPCDAFCPEECTEEVCCSNLDDNDCAKKPGKTVPPTENQNGNTPNPECDQKFCPCQCPDPTTGECGPAPVDDNGCQMEERKCVEKPIDPKTGKLCPSVIFPEECKENEVLTKSCNVCKKDICCTKQKDKNGVYCPPDYDHGCGACDCDCEPSGGLCCDGCVETKGESPGCKPKGKCVPSDKIPKDINGNDCPKESVCDCCCQENEECCKAGKGPDGCEKKPFCEPPMEESCKAVCPCVDGVTCPDGEKCCPGHKEHGCDGPPVCTKCGTKTEGNCKGEPCNCFCPASCKLPEQVACEVQIDCDGCPEEQVCRDKAKNVNGAFCDDDSASHGCPIKCNEQAGECECIPPEDILGCRGKATCVQRKTDNNGGFCPLESACPRHCTGGSAKDCGLDKSGCQVWRCGSCDTGQ